MRALAKRQILIPVLGGAGALAVVNAADGWRTALVAAALAGAIAASRVRYAPWAALALLAVVALVAQTGNGPVTDARPAAARDAGHGTARPANRHKAPRAPREPRRGAHGKAR